MLLAVNYSDCMWILGDGEVYLIDREDNAWLIRLFVAKYFVSLNERTFSMERIQNIGDLSIYL